ncbi:HAMP domain-containing sensor histidine kinase [Clostridium sp. DL1XJH146]
MRKKFSIKSQMAIIFVLIIIVIMGFASIYLPYYFEKSMENTFFKTIELARKRNDVIEVSDDMYAVNQIVLDSDGDMRIGFDKQTGNRFITPNFLEEIKTRAVTQEQEKQKYIIDTEDVRIYCEIDNFFAGYRVTFMFDVYGENFMGDIVKQLLLLLIVLVILGVVVMYIYSNYFANRIIKIKGKVEKIANGDWNSTVEQEGKDELSALSNSIEDMRIKLVEQDKYKNDMFQSISHDLKTPIMIINTYAQSIKDGLYPEGTIEDSAEAIIEESQKLDEKVGKILLINKLSYLSRRNEKFDKVNMKEVIISVVSRFDKLKNIDFHLNLEEVYYEGEFDKWCSALENIIANNLRYAESLIVITLTNHLLSIFNDGRHIEFENPNNIFEIYSKGKSGQTGIGLTITKTIVELFKRKISVNNVTGGVEFRIEP